MIPHVTCYKVWNLATAWQSCAHGAPACCPVNDDRYVLMCR